MKILIYEDCKFDFGKYRGGNVVEVSREIGKKLIALKAGEEETALATNQDLYVSENRPADEPQVIIMPYAVPSEEENQSEKPKKRKKKKGNTGEE